MTSPASVIATLFEAPERFAFFQAVHLLQALLADMGVTAESALVDHLRFHNSTSLAFPASQIESLDVEGGDDVLPRFHLTPAFMGFLGCHGALPAHYSERIAAWRHSERDDSPRAFLDVFSNRVLAQFYLAWRKYRVECDAGGLFRSRLLALAGHRADQNAGAVDAETIAYYAGLLQQRPVSSVAMARLLSDHIGVPCHVEETVGHMNAMRRAEQTSLSGPQALLGDRAMLGERSWRPDLRARLLIGPMARARFDAFLPGRHDAARMAAMLALFGSPGVVYEVRLLLRAADVRGATLDAPPRAARLGRDSFLLSGAACRDRDDVRYELRTMAPFPAD